MCEVLGNDNFNVIWGVRFLESVGRCGEMNILMRFIGVRFV
jgi:hypothetical protein